MARSMLFDLYCRQAETVRETVASWQVDHAIAMSACDLQDAVAATVSLVELLQKSLDRVLDQVWQGVTVAEAKRAVEIHLNGLRRFVPLLAGVVEGFRKFETLTGHT